MASSPAAPQGTGVMVAETQLHAGALSFPALLASSVALTSPGFSLLLAGSFIATQVGYSMVITYLGGSVICLAIGLTLFQLAREWPSAGSYFTYVSNALHPRFGFLAGWVLLADAPIINVTCSTIVGFLLQNELQTRWNVFFPWWAFTAIMIAASTFVGWRGIKISGRVIVALTFTELGILVAFAITGLINPGPGGLTLKPFTLDPAFGISGFALGVVYTIFAFTGFEAAVPLAEESKNPRRYAPYAVVGGILIMAAYYVVGWLGIVSGWGVDNFDQGFAGQPVGAFFTLGERLWGGWGPFLIMLALINSAWAIAQSCVNYTSRTFFSLGRAGVFPRWFGQVDNHVPRNAIIVTTAISIIWGTVIALWIGPDQAYFWTGLLITWAVVLIYGSGAVGVFWHWFRVRRSEFNWFWNLVVPAVALVGLGLTFYYSLPSLNGVFFWTLPLIIGWVLLGVAILFYFKLTAKEGWLLEATKYAMEHEATVSELADLDKEP
jgi:amino acid transporter